MTTTTTTERAASSDQSDRERFSDILAVQRAAYLRDGAPTLAQRSNDLNRFKRPAQAPLLRQQPVRDRADDRARFAPRLSSPQTSRRPQRPVHLI
jgi:hypothetical protein